MSLDTRLKMQKKLYCNFGPIVAHTYYVHITLELSIQVHTYLRSAIQADKLNEFACLLYM